MNNYTFYFDNYYNIIDNLFNKIEYNNNILFIMKYHFPLLEYFSHIIKKKNIYIDIITDDNDIINQVINEKNGEENENNINIYLNVDDIHNKNHKIYNVIKLFYINSIEYIQNIFNNINTIINEQTTIYLYCCLSNEKKINYKNYFRNIINKYTSLNLGNVLNFTNLINNINNFNFTILSLKIYKKNNYLLYGNDILYEIILKL